MTSDDTGLTGLKQPKETQTSQSSIFIPSQFPDNPMDGSSQSGHCIQTLQENDTWWMADLGSTQTIDSVSITNRKDCCKEQINGAMILVGDSPDQGGKFNARCAVVPSLGQGMTHIFSCGKMKGRYVTITHLGKQKVLSFCDVKIFGKTWDLFSFADEDQQKTRSAGSSVTSYNFDNTDNNFAPLLSKGKPAFQSSISTPSGSPERAVNGSLLDDFEKGTCIQTHRENNPWWIVDLGSTHTVKSVSITPRKDCCTEELGGALILVGGLAYSWWHIECQLLSNT
uniref:Pentraxin fusion protein-like n=1 Tax=Phascolarctos cinereus TaxID=38626 RepID=A0A6P5L2G8_PHACI|nr:pentraxin fusion protein-like [Phascolarctos cinereus]